MTRVAGIAIGGVRIRGGCSVAVTPTRGTMLAGHRAPLLQFSSAVVRSTITVCALFAYPLQVELSFDCRVFAVTPPSTPRP